MKQCPICRRAYDDTLSFCLDDGTPLIASPDSQATLVMATPAADPMPTLPAPFQQMPTSPPAASVIPPSSNTRTGPGLYIVIALLALVAGGGLVALLKSNVANVPANVASNPTAKPLAPEVSSPQAGIRTLQDVDLNGVWLASYPGGPLRVKISQSGKDVVASLIDGNEYVPAGRVTFSGRFNSNPFDAQQVCAYTGYQNPHQVRVVITIVDDDHFTEGLAQDLSCGGFPVNWERTKNR